MQIIIIGGGLTGLSLYLQLRHRCPKQSVNITILERHAYQFQQHESHSTFNGGLGVAPNGMRILRRLSPQIYVEVKATGFMTNTFDFRTRGGWRLGKWPASSSADGEGTLMIDQKTLREVLRRHVPSEDIREGAKVVQVRSNGSVVLEDGATIEHCIIDEGEPGREPEFQNLMNVGGSMPTRYLDNLLTPDRAHVVMTFGSSGFIGYTPFLSFSTSGSSQQPSPRSMWWSTYTDSPSEASRRTINTPDDPKLRLEMHDRHHDWTDPIIQHIVKDLIETNNEIDSSEKASLDLHTPTWIVRNIPRWSRGRVILIGDAAHALPSTSGQGVSQAFEDASALSTLFAQEFGDGVVMLTDGKVESLTSRYEQLRKPRVDRILAEALRMQSGKEDLNTVQLVLMYVVMWIVARIGRVKQMAWAHDYDIEKAVASVL